MRDAYTPETAFGDLLAAVERLGVRDPELVQRIATLLSMKSEAPPPETTVEAIVKVSRPFVAPAPPKHRVAEQPSQDAGTAGLPSRAVRRSSLAAAFAAPLLPLQPPNDEENELQPPFEPLLRPASSRAVVAEALASCNAGGPIDLDATVRGLGRGIAIRRLQRSGVPTLRKGAQVMVDRSSGMVPFFRDAEWLVAQMTSIGGMENVAVHHFRGLPTRGIVDRRRRLKGPYVPPPAGVPIVLLTDFGIGFDHMSGDCDTQVEWIEFIQSVRRHGNTVVAFVPYPQRRCPPWLLRNVVVVEWDRRSTFFRVHASLRRSWRKR